MSNARRLLVLGLGNVLLADDGVGAAAVARLDDEFEPPEGAHVLDGGTLGLSLLPFVEDADAVILVDAVRTGARPGTFIRIDGDAVPHAVATRLSPHQIGVADLLDGARWRERYPARVVLLGLEPESITMAFGLSPAVADGLQELVDRVVAEAAHLGFEFRRKRAREGDRPGRGVDVARLVGMS
jgi:hydrogenase maturation protease